MNALTLYSFFGALLFFKRIYMEIQRKLKWENFENVFGDWAPRIKPFFDKGGFEEIYSFLKKESKRGVQIAPKSENVFRAFKETSFDNLKVIIVGMAPYHTFYNDQPVADGLCLSCSVTGKLQPSLVKWYEGIEEELYEGSHLTIIRDPDLKFLANQGVMLLNSALTTSKGKPGNMINLWEPFMKYLFEEVLVTNAIPIVLLGREAQKMRRYIMPFTWIFDLPHPASAAYASMQWSSNGVFSAVNRILKENNNNVVQWIKTE